jgi:Lrp/AsnC family transcriptional regulator, leucine-responsive regulatory protein
MLKDEIDWKILELLQKNSRLSFAQIGREIGLSASAVADRIERLEDVGVIKGYSVLIDPKKIGLSISAFISISLSNTNYKPFVNSLSNFPEMVQCSRVTGKDCLIMKFHLKDSSHLEKLIDKLAVHGNPSTLIVLSEIIENGKFHKSVDL